MAFPALKNIALATALLVSAAGSQAQQNGVSADPGRPRSMDQTRPAPVSGRVGTDPAAVALHPQAATPNVTPTSTARPVPVPANANDPLLTPAEASLHAPQGASSAHGEPHQDHTAGKKKVHKVAGKKTEKRSTGRHHADKVGAGGKKSSAHAATLSAGKTAKKHASKSADKKPGKATDKATTKHVGAHRSKHASQASAQHASTSASGAHDGKLKAKSKAHDKSADKSRAGAATRHHTRSAA